MNKQYLEDALNYFHTQNPLGFSMNDDSKRALKGLSYGYIKKTLNSDELDYYFANYEQLKTLETKGNISKVKLCKYLKFFYKNNIQLNTVVLNKKVVINAEKCRAKIIDTLKYDFDSFGLKFGNVQLRAYKKEDGLYGISKYVGKSVDPTGYQFLYDLSIFDLELAEVTW